MEIHLDPEIYEQVKNGTKNVEARVNDAKRRRIEKGDIITVLKRPDELQELRVRVTQKREYKNFEELAAAYPIERLYSPSFTKEEYLALFPKFYSKEEIEKYGVVAIHFDLIEDYRAKRIQNLVNMSILTSAGAFTLGVVWCLACLVFSFSFSILYLILGIIIIQTLLTLGVVFVEKKHISIRDCYRKQMATRHQVLLIAFMALSIFGPIAFQESLRVMQGNTSSGAGYPLSALEATVFIFVWLSVEALYFAANVVSSALMLGVLKRVKDDRLEPEEEREEIEEYGSSI